MVIILKSGLFFNCVKVLNIHMVKIFKSSFFLIVLSVEIYIW